MLFPTASFALFFVCVFVGGWVLFPGRTSWRLLMVGASLFFCALFDVRFLWLFMGATLLGWVCLKAIDSLGPGTREARAVMILGVSVHVVVLVWFKLFGFFASSVQSLLGWVGIETGWAPLHVAIPVGISFLMFRGISATVDVYRGDAPVPTLLDHALFMTFFPYVAAGPVVRLGEIVPQWLKRRDPGAIPATAGLLLIAGGLVKKMLIADYLARIAVDEVFAMPDLYGSIDVLAGIYAYAVQIYCDFSGYTDMAIGIALLLGISLPQNFDAPYAAVSLQEFWRKWHMTLSSFLRDYVYIALGGSRRGRVRTYVNLVLTMVIGGLWHGAGFTFLIWGFMHGAALAIERFIRDRLGLRGRGVFPSVIGWFLTLQYVCVAWVFFRADSPATALRVLARVFTGWDMPARLPGAVWLFVAFVLAMQFVPRDVRATMRDTFWNLRPVWQASLLAVILFVVSVLGPEGPTAFIYAGF